MYTMVNIFLLKCLEYNENISFQIIHANATLLNSNYLFEKPHVSFKKIIQLLL